LGVLRNDLSRPVAETGVEFTRSQLNGQANSVTLDFSLAEQDMDNAGIGDARFFARTGPHTLTAVAQAACGTARQADLEIRGLAPLQIAGPDEVSFANSRRFVSLLKSTRAGAVIVAPDMLEWVPPETIPIVTGEPDVGWSQVAALFHPATPSVPGVHPSAIVAPTALIDPTAEVGPLCVIEERAEIGPRCRIGPGAVIGRGVVVGPDCRIGALASLSHALLGARIYVYTGARIGQEGFGFSPTKTGFVTAPQLGRVIIENDVEVGANTTIDRGSARDTVIGAGSRLDNLVQIGHNVVLGRCCVIVAQVGVAGSTTLGDFVQVGGQAGISGHLNVGQGARIGAQAGVMSDIASGAEILGSPAQPKRDYLRQVAALIRMSKRQK
jgi:UDP-3-O-[3-hydroxymyristoyl] glucosamine N-acyltransferase